MGPASRGDRAVGAAEPLIDAQDLLREATGHLIARAGDRAEARLEAEVLLAHVLQVEQPRLVSAGAPTSGQLLRFRELVRIRAETARPVAYLVGSRGFRELELFVDERVLVPRPETEHAVEVVLDLEAGGLLPAGPVLDRGTGSGAIALALAIHLERPIVGADLSAAALEVAALNRWACRAAGRVLLLQADSLSCIAARSLAVMVANPPYVTEAEFSRLPDDVRLHEPRLALVPDGGSPLDHYADLIAESARVLRAGGWLVTEVGMGQAGEVAARLEAAGWDSVAITPDLAGIDRVVRARWP